MLNKLTAFIKEHRMLFPGDRVVCAVSGGADSIALLFALYLLIFSREEESVWQCRNCGHLHVGKMAPEMCPVCAHPKAYFQLKPENY